MDKIITYDFNCNFLGEIAGDILKNFRERGNDFSSLAVVFGGRRPAYFLKRELSRRLKTSYISPRFFTIDEFMRRIVFARGEAGSISELDAAYIIYDVARGNFSEILRGRESFARFLPWARQIAAFIDELDLEDISSESLRNLQMSAQIGYDVPESLNRLLENIVGIRDLYHRRLRGRNLYSRGLLYRQAKDSLKNADFAEFERVIFANFYYLHKTEEQVLKHFLESGKALLFFQRDNRSWPVFDRLSRLFSSEIKPAICREPVNTPGIYKGFDNHSQCCIAREIIKKEILGRGKSLDDTLIVLADPDNLIPLLSEISSFTGNYNVSMGYPLRRSSLFSLFEHIFQAQARRRGDEYYSKDYLKVILHPLIKNLKSGSGPAASRILAHKIEEILLGMIKTELSGSLFVKLAQIEKLDALYLKAIETMMNMDERPDAGELKSMLELVHRFCFRDWEDISSFEGFTACLGSFLELLASGSFIEKNPLNLSVLERICGIRDQLKNAEFKSQPFQREEVFKIFSSVLEEEKISFRGSPLKGLQVLGLFETRSLAFKNVIVMDMNEGVLPNVSVYEPLIPRQIMEGLGLERLKQEEEIQRYHFMRLISSAENLYFIYNDSPQKERSRFLEEISWLKQKKENELNVFTEITGRFDITVSSGSRPEVKKNDKIISCLSGDFNYSPSSLDTYLRCPLQFYYQYVLRLREKEDLLSETEARDIGTFLHNFLELAYGEFLNKRPVIDDKFRKRFFEEFETFFDAQIKKRMGSEAFMVREVMRYRLDKFLDNEQERMVKEVLCLEKEIRRQEIDFLGAKFKFTCRIDRVDAMDSGSIIIIDYKTGSIPDSPAGFEKLSALEFSRENIAKSIHSFQLPIYYHFIKREYKETPLNAMLYSLRDTSCKYFIREKEQEKADEIMEICQNALGFILREIVDPKVSFVADAGDENYCKNCPFTAMCA